MIARLPAGLPAFVFLFATLPLGAQTVSIDLTEQHQVIDGFGAHQGDNDVNETWWTDLFYDDLAASIYRVDLTPRFQAPYSTLSYYSPWFMGSQVNSLFNLEDPDNPNGPEGNRVRTYTGPNDYGRLFGGLNAPIAVMGPDIDANILQFSYLPNGAIAEGLARQAELGDFKLIGSLWSPAPWLKVASGNVYSQNWWPGPVAGTPWPFVWGGNFAGGRLDVSGVPLAVFDDGAGPTSALTQFARSTAAYIRGFQNYHGVQFYAISIQNELNFEQFYNSATYPLSSQYIAALKAVRAEFDQYPDLQNIKIMGPEDLLGGDAYGMWEYGNGGNGVIHKNLQYLQNIAADPAAAEALDFFCIHGYGSDGVSASGATSTVWNWWVNGWTASPAPGIPANVAGFKSYGKKSWMTETSGENPAWLWPAGGYPNTGGWGVALRLHQALTTGEQSAWVYWTFTDDAGAGQPSDQALTTEALGNQSPKYVAAKHYFRYIRPGAVRVGTAVGGGPVLASAYTHAADGTLTVTLVNTAATEQQATLNVAGLATATFDVFTSSEGAYWQPSTVVLANGTAGVPVPGYGVVTLYGPLGGSVAASGPAAGRGITVAPNPAADYVRIHVPGAAFVDVALFDVAGRRLRERRLENDGAWHFDPAQELPAGVYYLKITDGTATTYTVKFIKN